MTIRLFEHDAQIALDEGEVVQETLTVTFLCLEYGGVWCDTLCVLHGILFP